MKPEHFLFTYRPPLPAGVISSAGIRGEVLPLQRPQLIGCNHVTGIVHSETDEPCGTVSDLIWPNDLFKRPVLAAVASWSTRTSCNGHCRQDRPCKPMVCPNGPIH